MLWVAKRKCVAESNLVSPLTRDINEDVRRQRVLATTWDIRSMSAYRKSLLGPLLTCRLKER